jgi:hypothetical protein
MGMTLGLTMPTTVAKSPIKIRNEDHHRTAGSEAIT